MSKFIQYELWKDCKCGCAFCYNKGEPSSNKLHRLNLVKEKLLSEEIDLFDEIGFIGGEFFDGQLENLEIKNRFYELFKICSDRYKDLKLNKICICTSLIFDVKNYLLDFLEFLKELNLLSITVLCTSYDTKYRFYTEERENLWKNNLIYLHEKYPTLKIHTETLLTQDFINKVLNDEFDIITFCKEYYTTIDYIEPSSGFYYNNKIEMAKKLPDFFPTKRSFIEFIKKTVFEQQSINLNDLLNPHLRANVLYYTNNNEDMVIRGRQQNPDRRVLKKVTVKDLDFGDEVRTVPQIYKDFDRGFIDSDCSMLDVVRLIIQTTAGD